MTTELNATPAPQDRRSWCKRCGSLDDVRMFSASGGKLASAKAPLCESCRKELWHALRLILANQPVTVDPAVIVPPPELPEFPDDAAEKPLFHVGDRVIPAGRNDPRLPDWTSGTGLAPEPAVVEKVRRWDITGTGSSMRDIANLWVYHLRTAEGFLTGPQTAYQLRAETP